MKTPLLIAAPLVAGALLAGVATPAFADGSPSPAPTATHAAASLSDIQAKGAAATSKRIASLTAEISKITSAKGISSSDQSTVLATLNADVTGMKTLATKIAADTSVSTARTDYRSIYETYRVYVVALPQARITAAADRLTGTAIPRLQQVSSKLATRVSGNSDLQAKLDDLNAQLKTASSDTDGLAAAALAVTPADFNANHSAMTGLHDKAKAALAAVKQAAQDAKAIHQGLKPTTK
ncbi:hypothetical protein [Pseudolysinimonas sp.]|uniref:hypothetical protein n=1 Tax=Pseudolysinimonas sp. TaxID=2680009 RepID=UPI003F8027C3